MTDAPQVCPTTGRRMLSRRFAHELARMGDMRAVWCNHCGSYHAIPKGQR
jgi:hypothetical protein